MNYLLSSYDSYFFDCDGVILDSNKIKSDVFYEYGLQYGADFANNFLAYHKNHGGISRFVKFEHFYKEILKRSYSKSDISSALKYYQFETMEKLLRCDYIKGFENFITRLDVEPLKFVISGGAEKDLLDIFNHKKIASHFNEIKGSPVDKYQHMESLIQRYSTGKRLFLGDSKLDYEVAIKFNCDFVFVYGKTEFTDWKRYFSNKNITIIKDFDDIL